MQCLLLFFYLSLKPFASPLPLAHFRERLFEIAVIDVLRRLGQRFFKNPLLGGNIDHRAHAFDVQIGVAIPDTAFPVIILGIAAMFHADRHFLGQIAQAASRLSTIQRIVETIAFMKRTTSVRFFSAQERLTI